MLTDSSTYTHMGLGRGMRSGPIGIVIFVVFQVAMWFYAYKNEEGIGAATITGFSLFILVVPQLLIPQVTDQPINMTIIIVFSYLGLSHLAYAIALWRMSKQSWWLDR